ncbi:MAG: tetratricopeptide repeat protein [Acidobacteriota bacterium]
MNTRAASRLFLVVAAAAAGAHAQDAATAWQDLYLRAQRAAGAHDYAAAEQAFQQALHEAERFGRNDSRVASTLNGLGLVYKDAKRYPEADTALRRALEILEGGATAGSVDVADITFTLASVLVEQGRQQAAIPLFGQSLSIYEQVTGGQSVKSASAHCAIGEAYLALKAWSDAERPLKRCADLREADGGVLSPALGDALYNLALVYEKEGRYALAEPRYRLAEKIRESTLGITSPAFAQALEAHAALLKLMGRDKEAARDETLAAAIRRGARKQK